MTEGDFDGKSRTHFFDFPGEEATTAKAAPKTSSSSGKALKPSKSQNSDENASLSSLTSTKEIKKIAELERKLVVMTAERGRLKDQRDTFSKQFDVLSNLRNTESEKLFETHRGQAASQAKIQAEVIENQTALIERLQAKVGTLEKALKEATDLPPTRPDPKEVKALKERVSHLEAKYAHKSEKLLSVEKEYKAEVERSRSLLQNGKAATPSTTTDSANPEEAAKDAACLRLYEDITDLNIANVKIVDSEKAGKETIYDCIQTHAGRSLNFKLKAFNKFDNDLFKQKASSPWVKSILYTPKGLENETDKAFVARLGYFGGEFTAPRDQLAGLFETMRLNMAGEEESAED